MITLVDDNGAILELKSAVRPSEVVNRGGELLEPVMKTLIWCATIVFAFCLLDSLQIGETHVVHITWLFMVLRFIYNKSANMTYSNFITTIGSCTALILLYFALRSKDRPLFKVDLDNVNAPSGPLGLAFVIVNNGDRELHIENIGFCPIGSDNKGIFNPDRFVAGDFPTTLPVGKRGQFLLPLANLNFPREELIRVRRFCLRANNKTWTCSKKEMKRILSVFDKKVKPNIFYVVVKRPKF